MAIVLLIAFLALLVSIAYWNYRRFYPTAESLGNEKHEIMIHRHDIEFDGYRLYGELILPKGIKDPPLLICSHGFNGSYQYYRNYVGQALAKSGYAIYCYDFHNGSIHSKSGGNTVDMSVFDERKQLSAVISHFLEKEEFAQNQIFLFGESQGGFVTALTAPYFKDKIKGLVLYYPAFSIQDDMMKKYKTIDEVPEIMDFMDIKIGKTYYEGFFDFDPYEEVSAYKGPVLIIHGDADRTVNASYGKKAADAYENAKMIILPGEDHGFSGKGKQIAAGYTYSFIQEVMKK